MKNRALIWVLGITGVALAAYVTLSLTKKKEAVNTPLFSASDIAAVGGIIKGLFSKNKTDISPYTGYSSDAGINYYDTGIGSEDFVDPNSQFVPVEEG